ncbi:hypothetical protein ACFQU2_15235 [Siccirubricoccus deserti]
MTLHPHGTLDAAPPSDWAGQIAHEVLRGRGFVELPSTTPPAGRLC